MKALVSGIVIVFTAAVSLAMQQAPKKPQPAGKNAKENTVLDFTVKNIEGKDVKLAQYKGDVLLIINVASECGLTKVNYTQLEPLYNKYKDKGLRILAFPCNDFGHQEPGTSDQIKSFCRKKYHGTYDLFAKVAVKGDDASPLYKFLTGHPNKEIAGDVMWNFQKYLVGRDGKLVAKFDPRVAPKDEKLTSAIEKALKVKKPVAAKKDNSADGA